MYRSILTHSYESLTRGGVSKLKNVMMELRKAVGLTTAKSCLGFEMFCSGLQCGS